MIELKNNLGISERKLKYPCIYKHFKGKYYATMGLSKAIDDIENICEIYGKENLIQNRNKYKLVIRHTEREEDTNDLVLYKTLYDDTGIFARPLDMFLEKVDTDKYVNSIQEYRFEEVYK
ncbi:DUF1653 domain-containing protein [Clostridioides difficile]